MYKSEYTVLEMAEALEVPRSAYYHWKRVTDKREKRQQKEDELTAEVEKIFKENNCKYGSPKIAAVLKKNRIECSRQRVKKIMLKNKLKLKRGKKKKRTTDSNHKAEVPGNLVQQDFHVEKPNEVWVSDITYIWTKQGWLYLAVIIDLFSRMVVGWAIEEHLKTSLVMKALKMALKNRDVKPGIMFHSDRGVQYASDEFRLALETKGFIRSMSHKGMCYDNAVAESFFAQLKSEEVYQNVYLTKDDAKNNVFFYIEGWYNRKRIHSAIDYKTPEEFEKEYFERKKEFMDKKFV